MVAAQSLMVSNFWRPATYALGLRATKPNENFYQNTYTVPVEKNPRWRPSASEISKKIPIQTYYFSKNLVSEKIYFSFFPKKKIARVGLELGTKREGEGER
jgi:hypothetical protein